MTGIPEGRGKRFSQEGQAATRTHMKEMLLKPVTTSWPTTSFVSFDVVTRTLMDDITLS